jgi:hypothetical protein
VKWVVDERGDEVDALEDTAGEDAEGEACGEGKQWVEDESERQ